MSILMPASSAKTLSRGIAGSGNTRADLYWPRQLGKRTIKFSRSRHAAALLFLSFGSLSAETLPEFRPALLGHGRRSMVNLINAESLMKRGQGDAIVMFSCGVSALATAIRCSPNSRLL